MTHYQEELGKIAEKFRKSPSNPNLLADELTDAELLEYIGDCNRAELEASIKAKLEESITAKLKKSIRAELEKSIRAEIEESIRDGADGREPAIAARSEYRQICLTDLARNSKDADSHN